MWKFSISHTWQESSTTVSRLGGLSFSFSMGLNSTFFISLSLMSGLAALISIFRLAVGVKGSARGVCLMGVMWARSGGAPFLFISKAGMVGSDFSGVDLLLSVQMFSCDKDSCVVASVGACLLAQCYKCLVKGSNFCSCALWLKTGYFGVKCDLTWCMLIYLGAVFK